MIDRKRKLVLHSRYRW